MEGSEDWQMGNAGVEAAAAAAGGAAEYGPGAAAEAAIRTAAGTSTSKTLSQTAIAIQIPSK